MDNVSGKEYTNLILPKDSSELFEDGELQRVPTAEDGTILQGFEEAEEGDSVDKFDLANADASNVKYMSSMFSDARSFNQDISTWEWDLNLINQAFPTEKFEELCEQMSYGYGAFEGRELRKLDEEKIRILVEHNIIGEETALSQLI